MGNTLYINENELTRFFHNRGGFLFVALTAVLLTLAAYAAGAIPPVSGEEGMFFESVDKWITLPPVSLAVCMAMNIATGYAVVIITKQFNTIRSMSRLMATLFLMMQTATPMLMGEFGNGTFIAAVMVIETALLFSCYDDKSSVRRIFLIFFILALCAMLSLPMLFYLPFLLLGLAQMKVFSFRALMASIIGIITPAWILLGFGIISPYDFRIPEINTIFTDIPFMDPPLFTAIVLSAGMGILFLVANLMKLLSYNARIRAYNGFFILMLFATIILMLLNIDAIPAYLPMLNLAASYQIAHFFAERRHRRSYIAILATSLPYLVIYVWNL
ncbi:MAG: hypothetical protein K2M07_08465 [Muribaculaceae bacterium]|nr:hypothetical protein [Muribaculaceae bacterium]